MRGKPEFCLAVVLIIISTAGGGLGSIRPRTLLTKISTLTSRIPGSGMDQGLTLPLFGYDGGGSFSLLVCVGEEQQQCCRTGKLNTEDDNWELGQVDWFVGRVGWATGDLSRLVDALSIVTIIVANRCRAG